MAEVHTKATPCAWPAHIKSGRTAIGAIVYVVLCQGVGLLGEVAPAPQSFVNNRAGAQTAADAWVVTCGLTPG